MLEHGVEDDQELAHASCEGQFLGLTGGQQPLVELPDDGVEATRACSHKAECVEDECK